MSVWGLKSLESRVHFAVILYTTHARQKFMHGYFTGRDYKTEYTKTNSLKTPPGTADPQGSPTKRAVNNISATLPCVLLVHCTKILRLLYAWAVGMSTERNSFCQHCHYSSWNSVDSRSLFVTAFRIYERERERKRKRERERESERERERETYSALAAFRDAAELDANR